MVREQIYINGKALDMPEDAVQLSLHSNALGKVGDITASYSYTIAIPRTLNNDRLLGQAWSINSIGSKAHQWLNCEYYKEGVKIYDARLYIAAIDAESYQCNMVWGFEILQRIKDDGKKLNELGIHKDDWLYLEAAPAIDSRAAFYGRAHYGYAKYSRYITDTTAIQNDVPMMPSVSVRYVLELIQQKYGLRLQMSQPLNDIVDNMVITLSSNRYYLNDDYPAVEPKVTTDFIEREQEGKEWYYKWHTDDEFATSGYGIIRMDGDFVIATTQMTIKNMVFTASANTDFYVGNAVFGTHRSHWDAARGKYVVNVTADTKEEVPQNARLSWSFSAMNEESHRTWLSSLEVSYTFDVIPEKNEVVVNSGYPIVVNLPAIKVLDFINELCAQTGAAPMYTKDGDLWLVSWDEIARNKGKIEVLGISQSNTHYADFAQRNILAYNTDDANENDARGELLSDDTTLEGEEEWYTSHFALLKDGMYFVMHEATVEDGELRFNKRDCTERLSNMDRLFNEAHLTSDGMAFSEIATSRYTTLQKAMRKPVVIDAQVRLTPTQLKNFALDAAYYVEQLASYFVVLEVENSDADIYDVRMIKL